MVLFSNHDIARNLVLVSMEARRMRARRNYTTDYPTIKYIFLDLNTLLFDITINLIIKYHNLWIIYDLCFAECITLASISWS